MKHLRILIICLFLLLSFSFFAQSHRGVYPQTQHLAPQVEFGWSNLCFGDSTYFINETIRGANYKWAILKSDTDTIYISYNKNMTFLFDSVGEYAIYLQSNNGHFTSKTKTIYVDSLSTLVADFSFIHCSNQFINMSGCASSYKWDFGNGITSTSAFPVHEYADTGHYTVKLTSYNGIDSATITKTIYIDCEHFPSPAFTWRQSYDTVFVHVVDQIHASLLDWLFSDTLYGGNVNDTFVVYPDTGRYDIVFHSFNACFVTGSDQWVHVLFPKHLDLSSSVITIFQNPVSNNGYLDLYYNSDSTNKVQYSIYNALGEEISRQDDNFQTGLNERKISVAGFMDGCYYLTFLVRQKVIRAKFIVAGN